MSIKIENLKFSYRQDFMEEIYALHDISFSIDDGDFVGIMGHTGCGKSTLIQLIAGLLTPTSGHIYLDGEDINDRSYDRNILREKIGLVFQYPEYQLFETTVEKDVAFGLNYSGLSKEEVSTRVQWALETMGFEYEKVRKQSPLGLSGGEKRRVAIAGVLATKPRILIFDEPIAGLDPYGRRSFLQFISKMNQSGTTVIMVSHNIEALCEYTKRLIVLDKGKLIESGDTKEVFRRLNKRSNSTSGITPSQKIVSLLSDRHINLSSDIVNYQDLLLALKEELIGGGKI
mgnify:CR=1 FL=1